MKRVPLSGFVGALLVLLGGTVMIGWAMQLSPLVRVLPGFTPMVFNTALCFVLAGGALLVPFSDADRYRRVTTVLGVGLLFIAALVLAEHLLRKDFGIDWPSLHTWVYDSSWRQPGRMSVGTAVGFLMSAAALLLATRVRRRWMEAAARLLPLGVGMIGVLGVAGHTVRASLLFPEYVFAGVAMHTAIGLLLLAVGLWSAWKRFRWGRVRLLTREDDRIAFLGATILVAIALAAGIVTFAIIQGRVQTLVENNVLAALTRRTETLLDLIELREVNARIAATRPAVLRNLRVIRARRDDGSNIANVRAVVESFVKEGFSGIAYYDIDGRLVASGGVLLQNPQLAATLATPDRPELLWDGRFLLRHRIPLRDAAGEVGAVLTEQPLPVLNRLMQRVPGVGQTGEVGLCERRAERLHCFPTRFTERVFSTPLLNEAGEPLPMTHALRGETGVVITADYRAQTVVAAHGPVGDLGLGMVVKIDAAEIFRPIREQLELALGLLVLLAVGGALLLRSQVKPVATRLIDAENRARSQERRFKDLIEFAPEAMVIVNQHGNIVLVNSLAEKLFGYSRTELLGQRIEVLLPEHYRGQHTVQRGEFFASPRARPMHAGLDLHGRRKDGTEFPADISLSPLETEEGTLVSSAIRDITDRKRIESTLQEKNVELANAMQAKDRFVASMSHELRTPLNAIIGFTGTLLMKLPGPLNADQEKQLRTVQTGANHLLALINDLLDLAKIEAGKVELSLLPADCQEVIEEVAAALRPQAEAKGLELTATVPQGLTVRTDRRALSQIVINLANNAIKFTERGSIRIRAERREEDGSRALEISVEDTGIGIRPEDQKKLFGAFTQVDDSTNRRYEGTGLGLHLSRKLAEALEGRIEVKSEYGKGSIFTLVLPEG